MTVASEITRLQGAKSCICSAIVNKGVSVSSSLKLDNYYSCINAIPTAVYLTQQEYDALPSSKLTDGVPYGIMVSGNVSKFIRNGTEYNLSPMFDYIVVGGGGSGGCKTCAGGGGGGGGGEVLIGTTKSALGAGINISIGAGGCGVQSSGCCNGGDTCLGLITARGGKSGCPGGYGAAGGGGASGNGCNGGVGSGTNTGAGGGGASGNGCGSYRGGGRPYDIAGNGGPGICGMGGGGGGGRGGSSEAFGGLGYDGGGNGGDSGRGCNAINYGGGGGGGYQGYSSQQRSYRGGDGCQGLVIVCYKSDGSCGFSCATGGTVTTSGDYTIHTFTSDGTFTIVS